jgi:hypothetical protein
MPYDYVTDSSHTFAVGRRGNINAAISSLYSDPEGQSRDSPIASPVTAGWFVTSH